jgi:hypothetical protein
MNSINAVLFATCLAFVCSCADESLDPIDDSYFPLRENSEWVYQRSLSLGNEDLPNLLDTLVFRVHGDTVIGGKSYKRIMDQDGLVEKIVRKEGTRYYGRSHELYSGFSEEYMFLDSGKPEGSSWTYLKDGGRKTEYVIKARNMRHNIFGTQYDGVIEVEVNYYLETSPGIYTYWLTSQHYYANGSGEIYNHYPYPVSGFYADSHASLMQLKR